MQAGQVGEAVSSATAIAGEYMDIAGPYRQWMGVSSSEQDQGYSSSKDS